MRIKIIFDFKFPQRTSTPKSVKCPAGCQIQKKERWHPGWKKITFVALEARVSQYNRSLIKDPT